MGLGYRQKRFRSRCFWQNCEGFKKKFWQQTTGKCFSAEFPAGQTSPNLGDWKFLSIIESLLRSDSSSELPHLTPLKELLPLNNKFPVVVSEHSEGRSLHEYLQAVQSRKESLENFEVRFLWQAVFDLVIGTDARFGDYVVKDGEMHRVTSGPPSSFTQILAPTSTNNQQVNFNFFLPQGPIPKAVRETFQHCPPLLFFNLLAQLSRQEKSFNDLIQKYDLNRPHIVDGKNTGMTIADALGLHMQFNSEIILQIWDNITSLNELVSEEKEDVTWQEIFKEINPGLWKDYKKLWEDTKKEHFLEYLQEKINNIDRIPVNEAANLLNLLDGNFGNEALEELTVKLTESINSLKGKELGVLFAEQPDEIETSYETESDAAEQQTKILACFKTEWDTAEQNDAFRAMMILRAMKQPGGKIKEQSTDSSAKLKPQSIKQLAEFTIPKCDLTDLDPGLIVELLTVILENFPEEAEKCIHHSWRKKRLLQELAEVGAPRLVREFLIEHCKHDKETIKKPPQPDWEKISSLQSQAHKESTKYLLENIRAKPDHVRNIRKAIKAAIGDTTNPSEIASLKQALQWIKYPHKLVSMPPEPVLPENLNNFALRNFLTSIHAIDSLLKQNCLPMEENDLNLLKAEYQAILNSTYEKKMTLIRPQVRVKGNFKGHFLIAPDTATEILGDSPPPSPVELSLNENSSSNTEPFEFSNTDLLTAPFIKLKKPQIPVTEYAHRLMQYLLLGKTNPHIPHLLEIMHKEQKFYCSPLLPESSTQIGLIIDFLLWPKLHSGSTDFSQHENNTYADIEWDLVNDEYIDRETRLALMHTNRIILILHWLTGIQEYNLRLPKEHPGRLKLPPQLIDEIWENMGKLEKILDENLDLTYGQLSRFMRPDLFHTRKLRKNNFVQPSAITPKKTNSNTSDKPMTAHKAAIRIYMKAFDEESYDDKAMLAAIKRIEDRKE